MSTSGVIGARSAQAVNQRVLRPNDASGIHSTTSNCASPAS